MRRLILILCLLSVVSATPSVRGQIITTIAGGATGHGGYWGDGGPATAAEFATIACFAIDVSGDIYIADVGNRRIRKVNAVTGYVNTVAGTGATGYSPDGTPATLAMFRYPCNVTVDAIGNFYITDCNDYRIRKVDISTGLISTFAGNGVHGYGGDSGPATAAQLHADGFSCWDRFGNMYIGDGRKIRKINPTGIITTVAGTGLPGITGEGVAAIATNIYPSGMGTDYSGNVYFADTTGAIRKIDAGTGIITRVAGTGDNVMSPYSGDGSTAVFCHIGPLGIAVDGPGNIYIADLDNSRAEKVNTSGIINSIAGTGVIGFSGDGGPATMATFDYLQNIGIDLCGNVYLADFGNRRLRKITYPPTLTIPSIVLAAGEGGTSVPVGSPVTVNATITNAGSSYIIHWMNHGIEFSTTTVPVVTYTKAPGIDTITARVVSTASYGCYDSTTSAPHYVSESTVNVAWLSQGVFSVYPNPAHGALTISGAEVINSVTITNLVGEVLIKEHPEKEATQISIAHLPPGMYLLRVNEVYVQRFMKE